MINLRTFCDVFKQRNRTRVSGMLKKRTSPFFLFTVIVFLPFSAIAQTVQGCAGKSGTEQKRCEEMFAEQAMSASRSTLLSGGWRLVKTANPKGGRDAVSIMHTSDTAKSDLNLAGLTFRCGVAGIEAVIIVLEPLPRGGRPLVSLQNGSSRQTFEASVIQGGEAILLPPDASRTVLSAQWQSASELALEIQTEPAPIKGIIPITGLPTAAQMLSQNCSIR